jgi:Spy/CpxP family protein refolding chaperone
VYETSREDAAARPDKEEYMTRYMIAAVALAGLTAMPAVPAAAQSPRPEPGRAPVHGALPLARMIEIYETLDLSEAQIQRIREINARLEEQNRPLREQLTRAHGELRAERRDMSPADRERMVRERAATMDTVRARMQSMTPAQRDSMRARVQDMTPAQRDSMRTRMKRPGAMRPPLAAGPLAARRPGLPAELRPVVEQMRANAESATTQIRDVLTAEQKQKLEELGAKRRPARQQSPHERRERRDAPRGRGTR